jgi:hypothetical protein
MKRALLLCAFLPLQAALAAEDCRVGHPVPAAGEEISWSGACKDHVAEGAGTLLLRRHGKSDLKYEVTLLHGEISGEGTMRGDDGYRYVGTFKQGIPDGNGYFHWPDGSQYEGDVVDGQPNGLGISVATDRTRYEGHWKDGKKDGAGRITWTLGGSYEGEWEEGKPNGKGILTYMRSGRQVEGEFRNGKPLGTAPTTTPQHTDYALKQEQPVTGSHIPGTAAIAPVPPDKPYAELTPAQKDVVRSAYPALDPGDEPPYPLHGPKELFLALSKISGELWVRGTLRLYVLVGADGTATSVTAIGSPDPELVPLAATAAMQQKYKPAVCDGQPCAMIYPMAFKFQLAL